MKIMSLLYPQNVKVKKLNDQKAGSNGIIPKEINSQKPEFTDLFNQDSPFRFMKINTSLMEETGINRNDIAVIDPEGIPVTGKIVVVKVDDTLMIRRYEKMKNGFLLHADAQKVSPLIIESGYDKSKIIGVVTFIIKSL